jgi:hypothetical protein
LFILSLVKKLLCLDCQERDDCGERKDSRKNNSTKGRIALSVTTMTMIAAVPVPADINTICDSLRIYDKKVRERSSFLNTLLSAGTKEGLKGADYYVWVCSQENRTNFVSNAYYNICFAGYEDGWNTYCHIGLPSGVSGTGYQCPDHGAYQDGFGLGKDAGLGNV